MYFSLTPKVLQKKNINSILIEQKHHFYPISMQQLANEMKQARGELKRLRTDLKKFKSEERHRMGKVEAIVSRGEISLTEKTQLETGNFNTESEPETKKTKLSTNENLNEKLKLSSLIATQIGIVKSPHLTKCGTPHQPGQLETTSTIYLNQGKTGKDLNKGDQRWMPRDVLDGLEEYSHCWILFHFHLNDAQSNGRKSKVAPPRGGGTKVGIFASRAPYRPSPIGLSLVKIIKIDKEKGSIDIQNCDLVNGTPVLGRLDKL